MSDSDDHSECSGGVSSSEEWAGELETLEAMIEQGAKAIVNYQGHNLEAEMRRVVDEIHDKLETWAGPDQHEVECLVDYVDDRECLDMDYTKTLLNEIFYKAYREIEENINEGV